MAHILGFLLLLLATLNIVSAFSFHFHRLVHSRRQGGRRLGARELDLEINAFEQLVDHTNPSLGTFEQRYYQNWEFYEPGGPIFLYTPGERAIDGDDPADISNNTIQGYLAQATSGAVIALEHRFYGQSQPIPDDPTSLRYRYHTIEQAMDDFVRFAQTVQLRPPGADMKFDAESLKPHRVPWVFVGGSYAGAVGVWMMEHRKGVFWAAYSSSGVVQPIFDFHKYYEPIERYLPRNCSSDIKAVIGMVDAVLDEGDVETVGTLKSMFGLEGLGDGDFAYALTKVIDWQSLDVHGLGGSRIYDFCDHLEVLEDGTVAEESGWGAERALLAWAEWYRGPWGLVETICGEEDVRTCLSLDGTSYATLPVDDENKSWAWTMCNELGLLQTGPPNGGGIISKHYKTSAWTTFCQEAFPESGFSSSTTAYRARVANTAKLYQGWETSAQRVFAVNGRRDPWIEATLSAQAAESHGRVGVSSEERPIHLTDGFHCSDMLYVNAVLDDSISEVWLKAVATFRKWLMEFEPRSTALVEDKN